ncbi:hypothetical protein Pfo_031583 [Paulownia fortunei]|nr:hypothetical protein Pfo_031583 [Paulownia fortunei]
MTSPAARRYPRAEAEAMPRRGSCNTVAPAARATSTLSSVLPLSTTRTSCTGCVCAASASRQRARCSHRRARGRRRRPAAPCRSCGGALGGPSAPLPRSTTAAPPRSVDGPTAQIDVPVLQRSAGRARSGPARRVPFPPRPNRKADHDHEPTRERLRDAHPRPHRGWPRDTRLHPGVTVPSFGTGVPAPRDTDRDFDDVLRPDGFDDVEPLDALPADEQLPATPSAAGASAPLHDSTTTSTGTGTSTGSVPPSAGPPPRAPVPAGAAAATAARPTQPRVPRRTSPATRRTRPRTWPAPRRSRRRTSPPRRPTTPSSSTPRPPTRSRSRAAGQQERAAGGLRSLGEQLGRMADKDDEQGIAAKVVRDLSNRAGSAAGVPARHRARRGRRHPRRTPDEGPRHRGQAREGGRRDLDRHGERRMSHTVPGATPLGEPTRRGTRRHDAPGRTADRRVQGPVVAVPPGGRPRQGGAHRVRQEGGQGRRHVRRRRAHRPVRPAVPVHRRVVGSRVPHRQRVVRRRDRRGLRDRRRDPRRPGAQGDQGDPGRPADGRDRQGTPQKRSVPTSSAPAGALGSDVDALADKVNPSSIAHRQTDRVKNRFQGVRDSVMGSAHSAGSSVSGSASGATDRAKDGNPLAVGLIAFGAGWLASSLHPDLKDKAAPLVEDVKSQAKDVGSQLGDVAKEHAQDLKGTAQDAAQTVKDEAQGAASDVQEHAKGAADDVRSS